MSAATSNTIEACCCWSAAHRPGRRHRRPRRPPARPDHSSALRFSCRELVGQRLGFGSGTDSASATVGTVLGHVGLLGFSLASDALMGGMSHQSESCPIPQGLHDCRRGRVFGRNRSGRYCDLPQMGGDSAAQWVSAVGTWVGGLFTGEALVFTALQLGQEHRKQEMLELLRERRLLSVTQSCALQLSSATEVTVAGGGAESRVQRAGGYVLQQH